MNKQIAFICMFVLGSVTLVKAQEPEVRIEVKEEKEKEEIKLPVEKKKNTPKTETTVREEQLQKSSGAGGVNVFKAVELTPSVHVGTDDAYGLGGGTITIRGFTNDQIGLEIDGMPLNDSGNYALYPHEYIDTENLEAITIERGATKKASPFYADIGGSIKLRTKPPKNKFGISYNLRYGSFNFQKEFIRVDTGLIPKLGTLKMFASFSHTEADKWKGPGKFPQYRDHLTTGIAQNLGWLRWEFYFDNNAQLNYFYRGLTYQQAKDLDKNRRLDYTDSLIFPGGNGTANNDATIRGNNINYYKFFKNPYDNREYRVNIEIDLPYGAMITLKPYYWWGRGSGTSTTTFRSGGNWYIAYRESYNYTDRPGIIADLKLKPTKDFDLHVGYWYEYAKLKQFRPSFPVQVNPDGSFTLITRITGPAPTFRYDYIQLTKTYTNTPYILLEGTNLMNKLDISLGLKLGQVKRDFKSYRTTGVPFYHKDSVYDHPLQLDPNGSYSKTYRKVLPSFSIGYKLTDSIYPYFSYARNFRVPKNYLGSFPTGYTAEQIADNLKPEVSESYDLGVRFDYGTLYVVPSLYYVKYKDRIIYFTDPNNPNVSYPQNVGKVDAYGAELEVALNPIKELSIYSSISRNIAKLKDSKYCTGPSASCIDIKDNQLPNTPKFIFKTGIEYKAFGISISPSLQYISSRYGDLTNQERVNGYTLVNLHATADIYKIRNRNLTAYLDIYNLFDKKFIGRISTGDTQGTYYVGAPFTVAVGIRGGF